MLGDFIAAHLGLMYELGGALVALAVVIVVCGLLISQFDKVPLEESIYFAFITAFTVGFGDVTPKSRVTRVVAVFLAILGVVLVGVVVAVAVHALDQALAQNPTALPGRHGHLFAHDLR